jgi:hypothetical protein
MLLFTSCSGNNDISNIEIESIESFNLPENISDQMIKSGNVQYGYLDNYSLVIASIDERFELSEKELASKAAYYGAYGLTVPLTGNCSSINFKKLNDNAYRVSGVIDVSKEYIKKSSNLIKYDTGCFFVSYFQKVKDSTYCVIVIDTTNNQSENDNINNILNDIINVKA